MPAGTEPRRGGHGPAAEDVGVRPRQAHLGQGRAPPPLLPRRQAAARPHAARRLRALRARPRARQRLQRLAPTYAAGPTIVAL